MLPDTNVIDLDVTIGRGTVIGAGVHLLGNNNNWRTMHYSSVLYS